MFDHCVPFRLKTQKTVIRPMMIYDFECWTIKKQHVKKSMSLNMLMLMCGITKKR